MKGLQHNVIEIRETDNRDIEKILVFLKPGDHRINVSATREEAADILRRVKIRRKLPVPDVKRVVKDPGFQFLLCGFVARILCVMLLW